MLFTGSFIERFLLMENIIRFTKAEFDAAIPDQFEYAGSEYNEHIWLGIVNGNAQVLVRSSISTMSDKADGTGENSIRTYIQVFREDGTFQTLKRKYSYITRLPNWETRLIEQLRKDWKLAVSCKKRIPFCSKCNKAKIAWIAKSGTNEGRVCCRCFDCDYGFEVI